MFGIISKKSASYIIYGAKVLMGFFTNPKMKKKQLCKTYTVDLVKLQLVDISEVFPGHKNAIF